MLALQVVTGAHKISGLKKSMTKKREERRKGALERQIDENLRRVYEQEVAEEVPDRFIQLLQQLREQE